VLTAKQGKGLSKEKVKNLARGGGGLIKKMGGPSRSKGEEKNQGLVIIQKNGKKGQSKIRKIKKSKECKKEKAIEGKRGGEVKVKIEDSKHKEKWGGWGKKGFKGKIQIKKEEDRAKKKLMKFERRPWE